jgi:cysteine synthase A
MRIDGAGGTPLVEIDGVYAKLECANPTGSVKDRLASALLDQALARGEVLPGDTVVEASTGNTGISLAFAARERGLAALIFMPESMSVERRRMMERLGARVHLTPAAEGEAGALARRDAFRREHGGWTPDQFANPGNPHSHAEGLGAELATDLRSRGVTALDAFVAGVGTAGTLMGVGRALRAAWPALRIVAVEPEEAPALRGDPCGPHGIMGIGDGFVPPLLDRAAVDEVLWVTTEEAHAAAVRLRRTRGLCVGRSAGANLIAAAGLVARGFTVATVLPDSADRYGSLGLHNAASPEIRCPQRAQCAGRLHALLGPGALPPLGRAPGA